MTTDDSLFAPVVRGTFYRAIDPAFRAFAIAGSRSPGRYSRADEPTLYLSSSVDGVEAAMIAHASSETPAREIIEVDVVAHRVLDLRDADACARAGIRLSDATAPWKDVAAIGGTPTSWTVRERLIEIGANGLIDPSRKRPGLWHLVLFRWNVDGAPTVRLR